MAQARRKASSNTGGENPEFILREFEGMNTLDAREAINDDEFYWCEGAIPLAPGRLIPVNLPSGVLVSIGETGAPTYTCSFVVDATYVFAVWKNSGNAWIVDLATNVATNIANGLFTSGATSATAYNNQGLLIVDASGYYDWNITAPNTLTPQNNTVASATLISPQALAGGATLRQFLDVSGTGASFQTVYEVSAVIINASGSGYVVGETLQLTDGSPTTVATLVVTTIGAGGSVTGINITDPGSYPGPTSLTPVAVGPTGNTAQPSGSGTGVTFKVTILPTAVNVLTNGSGYMIGDDGADQFNPGSGYTSINVFTIMPSGVISGVGIATYDGRVWIAAGRAVFYTDVDSYNNFGGTGGSFTITDSYLHLNITALFAANNYLYIFGDTSIDVLSNVTVANGLTSFSRINITASVGTSIPTSIFAYYRGIIFYHPSGFYLLSGATPERISEKISGLVQEILPGSLPNNGVYCCQVIVQGELCAAAVFTFTDIFTQNGTVRTIVALFFRGRWWVASMGSLAITSMVTRIIATGQAGYFWAGNSLYQAFSATANISPWLVKTKFYDGGVPLREKQSINIAVAGVMDGSASLVTCTVDTELGVSGPITLDPMSSSATYKLLPKTGNEGASQYLGLTVSGPPAMSRIALIALRGKTDRDFLQ